MNNDKVYDILKYTQRIALPAVLSFLAAVLPLLGGADATVKIIASVGNALIALMGALMQGWYNVWKKGKGGDDDGEETLVV